MLRPLSEDAEAQFCTGEVPFSWPSGPPMPGYSHEVKRAASRRSRCHEGCFACTPYRGMT